MEMETSETPKTCYKSAKFEAPNQRQVVRKGRPQPLETRGSMSSSTLIGRFEAVRTRTVDLVSSLSPEDQQIQGPDFASPTKWHLAHTTWFFETFLLRPHAAAPRLAPDAWGLLFNSYYESLGARHPRLARGLLSRPGLEEVMAWRASVDAQLARLIAHRDGPDFTALVELGLAHEEQHQELILTDLLANFALNPTDPAWRVAAGPLGSPPGAPGWASFDGGLVSVGTDGPGFRFDNEGPAHRVWLEPFALRVAPVSNAEVLALIEAGGYADPRLWLSDGIAWVREHGIEAPEYWRRDLDGWTTLSLYGRHPVDLLAPVCHVSAYEADAIATWLGARLPTEFEWEHAAARVGGPPSQGRWQGQGPTRPQHTGAASQDPLHNLWGEVWAWTRSSYLPYPGYRPLPGAVGEYNGKFMSVQWVLRGGSCATPPGHLRTTYRNFFYPQQRWQFAGLRLAR